MIRSLIALVFLGLATDASAEFHLIEAEKLELKYSRLKPDSRDPYVPEYTGRWQERASLLWRVGILERLYWDNDIHTETIKTGQVKTVGWHWEIGLRIHPAITPFMEHHSRHVMEEAPDSRFGEGRNQFPVEDSYGIRFRFIEEKPGKWIFGGSK